MSTQAVSNVSIFQELQSFYEDRRTDLRQLGSALQAGDQNQAQQVYGALTALGQSGPFSNSEPFANADRAKAFDAVGQALQAGDLAGAQAAFANLLQIHGDQHGGAQALPAFIVNIRTAQSLGGVQDGAESIYQQERDFRQQRKTDLAQLGTALQSGDVNAAQTAFNALVALGQNRPFRNGEPFQRTDRAQDFSAIGQALQSGDLADAQQAFAALASTFGHHHQLPPGPPTLLPPPTEPPIATLPPGPPTLLPPPPIAPPSTPGGGPSGPPEIIVNLGGSTTASGSTPEIVLNLPNASSKPEEVQINFGNSQGSGAQLTIDVSQQSGKAGEQIALNFNPGNTNYQLVLNLFDTGANNPAESNSLSLHA